METSRWNAEWIVYLPAIDAEHLQIHQRVEKLQKAVATGVGLKRIEGSVRRLAGEVGRHFVHEERLMRVAHYPAFAWHRRQHATARRKLDQLVGQLPHGSRDSISRSLETLARWFNGHIGVTDSMASSYLRNYERACGSRGNRGASRKDKSPL